MKRPALFCFLILSSIFSFAQGDLGDISDIHTNLFPVLMKNKVVIIKSTGCYFDSIQKKDTCTSSFIYIYPEEKRKRGVLSSVDASKQNARYFFYNRSQQLVCDSNASAFGMEYDSTLGPENSPSSYKSVQTGYVVKYKYDEQGRLLETISGTGTDDFKNTREYKNDSVYCYQTRKEFSKKLSYIYTEDKQGNLLKLYDMWGKDPKKELYSINKYDKNGNITEMDFYNSQTYTIGESYIFKNNKNGLPISYEGNYIDSKDKYVIKYEYAFSK